RRRRGDSHLSDLCRTARYGCAVLAGGERLIRVSRCSAIRWLQVDETLQCGRAVTTEHLDLPVAGSQWPDHQIGGTGLVVRLEKLRTPLGRTHRHAGVHRAGHVFAVLT